MYVTCGGGFSGTWRARLRAEAQTRLHYMVRIEESVDMSAGWATAQARVVCMRMTWHSRRSQLAPLKAAQGVLPSCRYVRDPSVRWGVLSCPSHSVKSSVVSHVVPVAVQLVFPSRGKQLHRSNEMIFPRQYSNQPGWKLGRKDDAGSQLSWAREKPCQCVKTDWVNHPSRSICRISGQGRSWAGLPSPMRS